MKSKITSLLLVGIQFACIFLILFTGTPVPSGIIMLPYIAGLFIGIHAIFVMRKSHLTVFPDFKKGSRFIKEGPYRYIRHPMYLAVILVCLSLAINEITLLRIVIATILTGTLIYKISYEEKQLIAQIPGYKEYISETKKLIPFLF